LDADGGSNFEADSHTHYGHGTWPARKADGEPEKYGKGGGFFLVSKNLRNFASKGGNLGGEEGNERRSSFCPFFNGKHKYS